MYNIVVRFGWSSRNTHTYACANTHRNGIVVPTRGQRQFACTRIRIIINVDEYIEISIVHRRLRHLSRHVIYIYIYIYIDIHIVGARAENNL
jgi:hypothetical protein